MNSALADVILSAIVGDAAGYTLNGMKKNHIKAVFKDITGYTDPGPALKNNMQRWKKPGLYSSISQNMLIAAACIDKRNFDRDEFIRTVKSSPEIPGLEYGIFRDPGEAEKNFIFRIKKNESTINHFDLPCSRLIPPVLPLLLIKNVNEQFISAVKFISLYTINSSTIACSIIFIQLIKDLMEMEEPGILKNALASAEKAKAETINIQDRIFDSGHNPDYIISELDSLIELFRELTVTGNPDQYEKIICMRADKKKTNTITRATVNLPETILPMAVALADSCTVPENIFKISVQEGGYSSSLASISAAITSARYGKCIPDHYMENLINKKRISTLVDLIAENKNRSSIITEVNSTEPGLTAKEFEEFRAKNKNTPLPKEKKRKESRGDIESALSKHIVESWTKLDKAKWKKDRKKENL